MKARAVVARPKENTRRGIGPHLEKERVRQDLTRYQVASVIGCREQVLFRMERGPDSGYAFIAAYIELLAARAPRGWVNDIAKIAWGELERALWEDRGLSERPACRAALVERALRSVAPDGLEPSTQGLGNPWQLEELMGALRERVTAGSQQELRKPKLTRSAAA